MTVLITEFWSQKWSRKKDICSSTPALSSSENVFIPSLSIEDVCATSFQWHWNKTQFLVMLASKVSPVVLSVMDTE